jgi:hypothetical protein
VKSRLETGKTIIFSYNEMTPIVGIVMAAGGNNTVVHIMEGYPLIHPCRPTCQNWGSQWSGTCLSGRICRYVRGRIFALIKYIAPSPLLQGISRHCAFTLSEPAGGFAGFCGNVMRVLSLEHCRITGLQLLDFVPHRLNCCGSSSGSNNKA